MALELPVIGQANTTADARVLALLKASRGRYESYIPILQATQFFGEDRSAGTYLLGYTPEAPANSVGNSLITASKSQMPFIYFDDADYSASEVTQKLRIRAYIACNKVTAAIKFTFGLYPMTINEGSNDQLAINAGAVVGGSTVEISEPVAKTFTTAVGSDFTVPADGAYALGCVTSGTLTNNSLLFLAAQLQTRSV